MIRSPSLNYQNDDEKRRARSEVGTTEAYSDHVADGQDRTGCLGTEIKSKFEFTLIGIIFDQTVSPPEPLLISILQIVWAKQICRIGSPHG